MRHRVSFYHHEKWFGGRESRGRDEARPQGLGFLIRCVARVPGADLVSFALIRSRSLAKLPLPRLAFGLFCLIFTAAGFYQLLDHSEAEEMLKQLKPRLGDSNVWAEQTPVEMSSKLKTKTATTMKIAESRRLIENDMKVLPEEASSVPFHAARPSVQSLQCTVYRAQPSGSFALPF